MTEQLVPSHDDPFLSPTKVAQIFDVKPATVRSWIEDGKLKATKVGNRWRIQHSEMVRFANAQYGDNSAQD